MNKHIIITKATCYKRNKRDSSFRNELNSYLKYNCFNQGQLIHMQAHALSTTPFPWKPSPKKFNTINPVYKKSL